MPLGLKTPLRACLVSAALLPSGSHALRSQLAERSGSGLQHLAAEDGLQGAGAAAGRSSISSRSSRGSHEPSKKHKRKHKKPKTPTTFGRDGNRDLVLMHIPFNFGHTVEKVAMMPESATINDMLSYFNKAGGMFQSTRKISWDVTRKLMKPRAEVWGHMHPELQITNEKTGCSMYYSPQKYWPQDLAKSYFGNKTIFGMLRDPAERLVSMFRGNVNGYGGGFGKYALMCDVNNGVKKALKDYKKSGDKFHEGCAFLPQSEYFEGRFGVTLPIDNRKFPESMQEAFTAHGYDNMKIRPQDILHVRNCQYIWAADLDDETKALIQEVYADDYKLLCKYFGYCQPEDTCITGVQGMCPPAVKKALKAKESAATGKASAAGHAPK